jgi:hypothetical protein
MPEPTTAWIESMIASGGGERAKVRPFAEAWSATEEPLDPTVPQQSASNLPKAAKGSAPKPQPPTFRIFNAFDPPPRPKRYERRYTEDGVCELVEIPPVSDATNEGE